MSYQVSSVFLQKFSPKEIHELKRVFKEHDNDYAAAIPLGDLHTVLLKLGENVTPNQTTVMLKQTKLERPEQISFQEFLQLLHDFRNGVIALDPSLLMSHASVAPTPTVLEPVGAAPVVEAQPEATPFFSTQKTGGWQQPQTTEPATQTPAFAQKAQWPPAAPAATPEAAPAPVASKPQWPPTGNQTASSVCDGVLLCKLINAAVPETIDERALNIIKKTKELNVYQKTENQNLCINAAKSIGCSVVNIGPDDLIEGKPILVLGLVWQIIKIQLTSTINLKNHPELMRLLLDGETLEEFMKLPPDQILLRWMNYHLKAAGHPKKVTNFSTDVKDATAYSVLLHHIAPQTCDLCLETVPEERAAHVIQNARRLTVETFIKPRDITSGNPKLNMSFVAQLFNTCPALDVVEEEIKQLEEILYDDVGDTREERVFRMWINSLAIDDLYINHLYSDLSDGMKLLKVLDKIQKGIVSWNKVNMVALNKFKQVENCNYCVVLGKQLKFSLVNVGGADIFEGAKKMILSIVWQSMRYQQLKILSELAKGRGEITDKDIIGWANEKVRQSGRVKGNIVSFRDSTLSDGLYLLDLVHAVEPRAVNWDMISQDKSDDAKASNAKYAISCAQKIGATVFLTYEDIVEVKPKMMMTFVASLMSVDHQNA
ncbi:hypothetical protein BBO99_00005223 [Phytophthora kernoviae]|uniref:Calponin-homology (CH) domain-containing protein n=1 Tax=Phytophthora kernoviae TaxID=325452 RepID=A0A3R7JZ15_9STRA|nr:hypothetical protein JM16_004598 [Phytophthora kernoviae]RLN79509.1 hypothetical protein BBO99_00005223 [Phytophthora kernoviae]